MRMNKKWEIIKLKCFADERGKLNVIEGMKDIPFDIKRIFYEYDAEGEESRGNHANRESSFCLMCVSGSCVVDVDDGVHNDTIILDNPSKLLYMDKLVWKVMKSFSKNCVLLILSDKGFNKKEYIYDYNEYLKEVFK